MRYAPARVRLDLPPYVAYVAYPSGVMCMGDVCAREFGSRGVRYTLPGEMVQSRRYRTTIDLGPGVWSSRGRPRLGLK